MTTTATKVETKWDTKQTQEVTAHMFAALHHAANEVLGKFGTKALDEFDALIIKHKIDAFKKLNVKTPMDLVKAMAERDHNLFGSKVEISGDDKKATLKYHSCGLWEAGQKLAKLTPNQEKAQSERCTNYMNHFAKESGFTFEPKHVDDSYEMTFSK